MYKIYTPLIIGTFFKEERAKRKLTMQDIANLTFYSPGTISILENTNELIDNEKKEIFLKALKLPLDYFSPLEDNLDYLIEKFLIDIIYINEEEVKNCYNNISKLLHPYQDTTLYLIHDLCTLIYNSFIDKVTSQKIISNLEEHKSCFEPSIQCLCNLYIGNNHLKKKEYDKARYYFTIASQHNQPNHKYLQTVNYCLGIYYFRNNDILGTIKYINLAKNDFTNFQNYKRLINVNILSALLYTDLHYFSKAKDTYILCLSTIEQMKLNLEKRIVLYNLSFIYSLESNYEEAINCLTKIPSELLKSKHYFSLMHNYFELENNIEAQKVCKKGLELSDDRFYRSMLKAFDGYFKNNDLKLLCNKIIKIFQNNKDSLSLLAKEYFLLLIIKLCKNTNQYKRANQFLEELYKIRIQ